MAEYKTKQIIITVDATNGTVLSIEGGQGAKATRVACDEFEAAHRSQSGVRHVASIAFDVSSGCLICWDSWCTRVC